MFSLLNRMRRFLAFSPPSSGRRRPKGHTQAVGAECLEERMMLSAVMAGSETGLANALAATQNNGNGQGHAYGLLKKAGGNGESHSADASQSLPLSAADVTSNAWTTDQLDPRVESVRLLIGSPTGERWVNLSELDGRTAPWAIYKVEVQFVDTFEPKKNQLALRISNFANNGFNQADSYNETTHVAIWNFASTPLNLNGVHQFDLKHNAVGSDLIVFKMITCLGDVNGDFTTNNADGALARKLATGFSIPDQVWSDFNGDGATTTDWYVTDPTTDDLDRWVLFAHETVSW